MANQLVRLNNVDRFNRSLVSILEHSRGPVEKTMRKQAKLVVEKVLSVTPPASGHSAKGKAAERRGKKTTAANIQRVLVGVPVSTDRKNLQGITESEIAREHEKHRRQGTIRRNLGKNRKRVPTNKLKQYIKARQKAVGMLMAGWKAASSEFGVSSRYMPAWVSKHSPASSASFKVTRNKFHIKFSNKVRYASNVNVMRKRLDWALHSQARGNEKIIANYKGAARRAGFRVT